MKLKVVVGMGVIVLVMSVPAQASILYGPDQMTNAAGWGTNIGGDGDVAVTFGYDYSADGIPEAPNSTVGDLATRGLKMEANNGDATGAAAYFTAYPLGQNFTGIHQLRFDAWMNFEIGGQGTTEFLGGGVGYDNVTADIASGTQTMATGEGGSSNDWRAFKSPPQFFVPAADMAGGTRQGSDPYYADFLPGVAPPAAQGQVGTGVSGSPSFQWVTWVFTSINEGDDNLVFVDIEKPGGDTLRIVEIDGNDTSDGSSGSVTEGNISLFYADFFTSVSSRPDLAFGLIDNVVVTDVPEPGTLALLGLGAVAFARRRH